MTSTPDLATAGATWIRLGVGRPPPRAPWTATRAVEALRALGATPCGRPDVLGAGHGEPLVTRHDLDWRGIRLHVEYHRSLDGSGEVALELPPWDELQAAGVLEGDGVWEIVDALAAAVDATHGGVGDEDAVIAAVAGEGGRRLAAELVREDDAVDRAEWTRWRTLEVSELAVFVRK